MGLKRIRQFLKHRKWWSVQNMARTQLCLYGHCVVCAQNKIYWPHVPAAFPLLIKNAIRTHVHVPRWHMYFISSVQSFATQASLDRRPQENSVGSLSRHRHQLMSVPSCQIHERRQASHVALVTPWHVHCEALWYSPTCRSPSRYDLYAETMTVDKCIQQWKHTSSLVANMPYNYVLVH